MVEVGALEGLDIIQVADQVTHRTICGGGTPKGSRENDTLVGGDVVVFQTALEDVSVGRDAFVV